MFQWSTRTACANSCRRRIYASSSKHYASRKHNLSLSLVVFTSILALSCALFPHFSYAAQGKSSINAYAKASQPNDTKPYWTWDDATKTLNFKYGEMPAGATEISLDQYSYGSTGVIGRSWNSHQVDCQHVVIDPSFNDLPSVPYLTYWFADMSVLKDVSGMGYINGATTALNAFSYDSSLESVDFKELDFSEMLNLNNAFSGCSELSYLDLSGINAPLLETLNFTFAGCGNLQKINLAGTSAPSLRSLMQCFRNCRSLTFLDLSSLKSHPSNSTSGAFFNCANLKEIDVKGLIMDDSYAAASDSSFPYAGDSLARIIATPGSFDYVDTRANAAPAGTFYAYQNGAEVPGDVAGPISTSRITGNTPTIFITDKSATYADYFYANGGSFSNTQSNPQVRGLGDDVQSTSGTIDTKATAPGTPVRDGYIFKGWTTADGASVEKDATGNYDFGNYGISNNFTFYADWVEDNPVTLTFDANGGTFASTGNTTITLDNQVPGETLASVEEPKQGGYTFAGWVDASGATVVFPLTIPEANTTYTATWTAEPGPGPTPPDPGPGPEPTPSPSTDGSELLPVTGDTYRTGLIAITIVAALAALVATLALGKQRSFSRRKIGVLSQKRNRDSERKEKRRSSLQWISSLPQN